LVAPTRLLPSDAPQDRLAAVAQPIREQEFGSSPH
jgi:hypothetical protein